MLMASFPKAPSSPQAQQEAKQVRSKSKGQPKRSCAPRTCGSAEPRGLRWMGAQRGSGKARNRFIAPSVVGCRILFVCFLFVLLWVFFLPPDHNHVSKLCGCHSTQWELRIWIYIWTDIKNIGTEYLCTCMPRDACDPPKSCHSPQEQSQVLQITTLCKTNAYRIRLGSCCNV